MSVKAIFSLVLLAQTFLISVMGMKYNVLFKDKDMFSPCDIPNVYYLDEYLDLRKWQLKYLYNGSVSVTGEAIWRKDTGTKNNKFTVLVEKKHDGKWTNTIYSQERRDFCKSFFHPLDLWQTFSKDIQGKDCPLYKGQVFSYYASKELSVHLADVFAAGEYNIQIRIDFSELNEALCLNVWLQMFQA